MFDRYKVTQSEIREYGEENFKDMKAHRFEVWAEASNSQTVMGFQEALFNKMRTLDWFGTSDVTFSSAQSLSLIQDKVDIQILDELIEVGLNK